MQPRPHRLFFKNYIPINMVNVHDWAADKVIRIFFRKQFRDALEAMLLSMEVRGIEPLIEKKGD
jgi:hypothetical protein